MPPSQAWEDSWPQAGFIAQTSGNRARQQPRAEANNYDLSAKVLSGRPARTRHCKTSGELMKQPRTSPNKPETAPIIARQAGFAERSCAEPAAFAWNPPCLG